MMSLENDIKSVASVTERRLSRCELLGRVHGCLWNVWSGGVAVPRIEWDTSFSVDNDEIDAQHKAWIGTLNTLHDSMIDGEAEDTRKVIIASLEAMISYTRFYSCR